MPQEKPSHYELSPWRRYDPSGWHPVRGPLTQVTSATAERAVQELAYAAKVNRMLRFRSTASPTTFRPAAPLAAVPLNMWAKATNGFPLRSAYGFGPLLDRSGPNLRDEGHTLRVTGWSYRLKPACS